MIMSSLSLVLLLIVSWFSAGEAKKFVICVGPHETHTGVTTFLSEYAAGDGSGNSSFDGWIWPIIESEKIDASPHHVFDSIVKKQDDDDIQDVLIDGIKSAWAASEHGVFIGSLDFDKVGSNPYSSYDAVESLIRVVDEVGISAEDVTVIVSYRSQRVGQWGMVHENHFDAESYKDFICSDEQASKRWEWLDTSMNPFKVAKAYYDQKWNVVAVDVDSITKAEKNIASVIACLAMENQNCEDGRIDGIEELIPNASFSDEIDDLHAQDRSDLEKLFLFRDCYYVTHLDDQRFEMFDKTNAFGLIQEECKDSLKDAYAKLSDTSFLLNAMQSQVYCETDDIDLPNLLTEISDGSITDDKFIEANEPLDDKSDDNDDYVFDEYDDNDSSSSVEADVDEGDESSSSTIQFGSKSSSKGNSSKKLVIFVGPHETEAVDVTKFFLINAAASGDNEPSESFNGWSWPIIEDEIIQKPNHRVFDLLVTEPDDEDIQSVIISGIKEAWNNSNKGLIIGSLDFDWIGTNPYSNYDPIEALHRVVEALGIQDEDVTVAVTYRAPRIDHWSVIWDKHFESNDYEDFICSDGDQSDKRWEWLDVVMNPFKIAKTYHDEGWNVAVVDQEGTINAGMDVAHTIACNLMEGVNCKNGWVHGSEDFVAQDPTVIGIDSLGDDDRRNLEQLFRQRDCYYKYELKNEPGFEILNQHSAWSSCSGQHKEFYQQFTDTDFMLNLLKSQMQCGTNDVNISNLLEKKMVHDDQKQFVVFAGPHETSGVPVTKFFVNHVSDEEGTNRSSSLDGWTWPIINSEIIGDTQSHRTFDLLLSDADTRPVQNIIMDGIRDSWNEAQNGVIIGSLDLDRVGKNPYSSYDALGAVDRVVQTIGIADSDVTVVLNYRSKRLDHLSAVWYNHFESDSFQDFICSNAQAEKRWEWMDTVMNPLKVANAYIEQGWNVAMIDQEGTSNAGKDVAHTIACDIMANVDCSNGWVDGLQSETIDIPSSYKIDELDNLQSTKFETLFLMRDCLYRHRLESDNKFTPENREELWKSCSPRHSDKFEMLADTDFILEVMRSLLGCGDKSNLNASRFANELLKLDASSTNSTLIIATLFLSFAALLACALYFKERRSKRKKVEKAALNPSEGVYRDNPDTADFRDCVQDDSDNGEVSVDTVDDETTDSDVEAMDVRIT